MALEMWILFSGFEVNCVILPAAFALTNLSLCPWLPAVFRILVSQILDRTEPVLYSSMSSETITVFQYYNYFASHSVNDLGSYLLQLAKEGRVHKFCWLVREYIPVLLSSTQSSSEPWGWFYKRRREKRQRSALLLSECTWTVVHVKGKQLMQTDPQSFLFPHWNEKKIFWKHCFSGNGWWWWAEPKVWEVFCAHSLDDVLVFHHVLWRHLLKCWAILRKQGQADHSTSEFCKLCHQELKREADTALSALDCSPWQAKFPSLFERDFEEPCLVFLFIWAC